MFADPAFLLRAGDVIRRGSSGGRGWGGTGSWNGDRGRWRCVRGGHSGIGLRSIGDSRHRALGVKQVIFARSQAKADQGTRIGNGLTLPSVIGLIPSHRILAGLIPGSHRLALEVVFAN